MAIPKDQATSASWDRAPATGSVGRNGPSTNGGNGRRRSRIPLWLRDSVRPAVRRAALERRRPRGPARLPRAGTAARIRQQGNRNACLGRHQRSGARRVGSFGGSLQSRRGRSGGPVAGGVRRIPKPLDAARPRRRLTLGRLPAGVPLRYEMALAPRFQGRPWPDVEPGLAAVYDRWAAARVREGVPPRDRISGSVRDAWEAMTGRRSE